MLTSTWTARTFGTQSNIALLISMLLSRTATFDADIHGVWMIEGEVAVEVAECAGGSLCCWIV